MDISTGAIVSWIVVAFFGALATIFKANIGRTWHAYSTYKNRQFDMDGDPNTPNPCQMLNGAKGEWGDAIVERYLFWCKPSKWGTDVLYPDGGKEHFNYDQWEAIRKREPPPDHVMNFKHFKPVEYDLRK